jgi:cellulose synthase/poly-beta-1,6-N-acetylglucosamine synthase-like glycosyltransferase
MLNKALQAAQTDYAVFIDGDCIPHHDFLSDHWNFRREKALLCGRRVNLGKILSEQLTLHNIENGRIERLSARLWLDGFFGRSTNVEESLRFRSPLVRRLLVRADGRILGCNFSVHRKWLEEINGFNEDYHAPGRGEDSDIAFRLGLLGIEMVSLRYLAILYHMYHSPTPAVEENKVLYERMVARREIRCVHGIRNLESDRLAFQGREKL